MACRNALTPASSLTRITMSRGSAGGGNAGKSGASSRTTVRTKGVGDEEHEQADRFVAVMAQETPPFLKKIVSPGPISQVPPPARNKLLPDNTCTMRSCSAQLASHCSEGGQLNEANSSSPISNFRIPGSMFGYRRGAERLDDIEHGDSEATVTGSSVRPTPSRACPQILTFSLAQSLR